MADRAVTLKPRTSAPRMLALLILMCSTLNAQGGGASGGAAFLQLPSSDDRCATTAYQVLGQAWRVGLSTGGFLPDAQNLPPGAEAHQPRLALLPGSASPPAIFPKLDPSGSSQPHRVSVIVVDNFAPQPITMDRDAPRTSGQPVRLSISHGEMVMHHLRTLLLNDGFQRAPQVNQFQRGQRIVQLSQVDIAPVGGRTSGISEIVRRVRANLGRGDVIVNMSLALLPCQVFQRYTAKANTRSGAAHYTIDDFIQDEVGRGVKSIAQREREIFQRVPETDPLIKALSKLRDDVQKQGRRFIAVASSGNYGLPFSTVPGALPTPNIGLNVMSVGTTNWAGLPPGLPQIGDQAAESDWSDQGDVRTVGEWFSLTSEELQAVCKSPNLPVCNVGAWPHPAYRGTSFSAPSVTALLASRLLPGERCIGANPVPFLKGQDRYIDGSGLCIPE